MIYLYTGVPGSGKSLDSAQTIYNRLRKNQPVICNFPVNFKNIKSKKPITSFTHVTNAALTPAYLIQYATKYWTDANKQPVEDSILLVIDEAQILFNSRSWQRVDRAAWVSFFSQHRKYGYKIIMIAQFDRSIDRQIRSLVEVESFHRKASSFNLFYRLLGLLFYRSKQLFVAIDSWYGTKVLIRKHFFTARKTYTSLYNTFDTFQQL